MSRCFRSCITAAVFCLLAWQSHLFAQAPAGFASLFNGRDLTGWKVPEGDNGHWKVVDGVIDYDAMSEAKSEKHLWTDKQYGDFTLLIDWRLKSAPFQYRGSIILPDGSEKLDEKGEPIVVEFPDADSGILLRGGPQVNIWCWPIGSGELWSVRRDKSLPPQVRAAATPKLHADHNIGEWNTFEITLIGQQVTIVLNGQKVIDQASIPGIQQRGSVGLQHHGNWNGSRWTGPPSLIQFRRVYIKEL
jgi:3-keto-disaccharide hydrolase